MCSRIAQFSANRLVLPFRRPELRYSATPLCLHRPAQRLPIYIYRVGCATSSVPISLCGQRRLFSLTGTSTSRFNPRRSPAPNSNVTSSNTSTEVEPEATRFPPSKKSSSYRRKNSLRRAIARLKSRFALFKVRTRYREFRRKHLNLTAVKKYFSEKRLKFGATPRAAQRRQKMREFKEKVKQNSTALKLGAIFAIKKYGKLGGGIYLGVYIATLIFMNVLTFNDYLSSSDVRRLLKKINISHFDFDVPDMDSYFAKFTVAYIATKIVEPVRLVVSLLVVWIVNRALKRRV